MEKRMDVALLGTADYVKKEHIFHRYTDEEMIELQKEFSEKHILLKNRTELKKAFSQGLDANLDIDDIIEQIIDPFRDRLEEAGCKFLKNETESLRSQIEANGEHRMEEVFGFADYDKHRMNIYDKDGNFIYHRALKENETQGTIFKMDRTGTND